MAYGRKKEKPLQLRKRIPGKRQLSPIKGNQREINNLKAQQRNSTETTQLLKTRININGHKTTVIIDSGATANFIAQRIINNKGLPTRRKNQTYTLNAADKSSLTETSEIMELETKPLPIAIQQHHEKLTFNIVKLAFHDVILKLP